MSLSIRELLTEDELAIVLDALNKEEKRCKTISTNSICGHGRVSEYEKRKEWGEKAEKINQITNTLANSYD